MNTLYFFTTIPTSRPWRVPDAVHPPASLPPPHTPAGLPSTLLPAASHNYAILPPGPVQLAWLGWAAGGVLSGEPPSHQPACSARASVVTRRLGFLPAFQPMCWMMR